MKDKIIRGLKRVFIQSELPTDRYQNIQDDKEWADMMNLMLKAERESRGEE